MAKTYRCEVKEGSIPCAFMPTSLDSRSHKRLRFTGSKSDKKGNTTVLSSCHPENTAIAVEGTKIDPSSSRYLIGVINEETGSISLHHSDVYSVQSIVRLSSVAEAAAPLSGVQAYLEKKKELINTYAPVKKQRQLRAAVNSIVSDEKIEGFDESIGSMRAALKEEDLLKAASSSQLDTPSSQQQSTGVVGQMQDLLPPFDLTAKTPGGIFDFGALFGDDVMASFGDSFSDPTNVLGYLYKWVSEGILVGKVEEMEAVGKLQTVHQLVRLFNAHKQEKKKNMAKLLSIVVSMIFLLKEKRKKNWSSYDIYSASEPLTWRLGELYSPTKEVGSPLDRETCQKLLAHMCLFILRLTPFWEFDFGDLKSDLNLQPKELHSIMAFCGISAKSGSLIGRLKAPLVVQAPYQGGQKRRAKK